MALEGSLYNLIFKQILGLSACRGTGGLQFGCLTGDIVHDFIFALFLPHVIIVIFLFLFSDWAHLREHHKGLSSLLGIAAYVFIIYAGWYSIIATLGMWWLALGIALSFFNFLWTRVLHPTKSTEMLKAAKDLGGKIGESMSKSKKLRILRERQQKLENLLQRARSTENEREAQVYAKRLQDTREKIKKIQEGID